MKGAWKIGAAIAALGTMAQAALAAPGELSLPSEVLAGVWELPVFYSPAAAPAAPPVLVVLAGGDTLRAVLDSLPRLAGGPRYGAFVDDLLLADLPSGEITVNLVVADTVAERATIPIRMRLEGRRVLSIGSEGAVLWEEDGAGGLVPWDTLTAEGGVEQGLLLANGRGGGEIVAVTGAGDVVVRSVGPGRKGTKTIPVGGRPSVSAPGAVPTEGFLGLIDGRVLRVTAGAGGVDLVVAATARGIPTSIAVGDATGDGVDDLVATVLEMDRSVLVCWTGAADGTFRAAEPRVIPLPGTGRTVLFADLRGEGEPDLLLLMHGPDVGLSGVSVWRFAGSESLETIDLPGLEEESVHRLVTGDWNGDGAEDIGVLAGLRDASVRLFVTEEGGRAGRPVCVVPTLGPESDVSVRDLDGNGADDLLVAEGRFRVWLNDGRGRMTLHPHPPMGAPSVLAPGR